MKITEQEFEKVVEIVENFVDNPQQKTLDLTDKQRRIFAMMRIIYIENPHDKEAKYYNNLVMKACDKMQRQIAQYIKQHKKQQRRRTNAEVLFQFLSNKES